MHDSVLRYVRWAVERWQLNTPGRRVLDVGAFDVNGTVRPLLGECQYTGLDIRPGVGVDTVIDPGAAYPYDAATFDVVVSTEMLEHDLRPWWSLVQMARVARTGAWLIVTARGYDQRGCFPVHEHPGDYWRYTVEGLAALVVDSGWQVWDARPDPDDPGVFLTAER